MLLALGIICVCKSKSIFANSPFSRLSCHKNYKFGFQCALVINCCSLRRFCGTSTAVALIQLWYSVEGCGIVGDCVGGSCEDSDVGIEGCDDGVDSAALFSNMSLNA